MVKRLDPQTREELKFDLRMGMGTMDAARKFGISPGTVSGYRARISKENEQAADKPVMSPIGEFDIPVGLDPQEWLERVRDNPNAPWDARKAAGIQLYRNSTTVKEDTWTPANDPDGWAADLALLVLGQTKPIAEEVFKRLAAALHYSVTPKNLSDQADAAHNQQQGQEDKNDTHDHIEQHEGQ